MLIYALCLQGVGATLSFNYNEMDNSMHQLLEFTNVEISGKDFGLLCQCGVLRKKP